MFRKKTNAPLFTMIPMFCYSYCYERNYYWFYYHPLTSNLHAMISYGTSLFHQKNKIKNCIDIKYRVNCLHTCYSVYMYK